MEHLWGKLPVRLKLLRVNPLRYTSALASAIAALISIAAPAFSQQSSSTQPASRPTSLTRVLRGHEDGVLCAAFSPDDRFVVTGSADKTARVWDVATGAERFRFEGHQRMVTRVAWSANGRRIATAGPDYTARVWDAVTGELVAILQGHKNHVHQLAISSDGSRVVTGSCDGSAICWDVTTEKPLCSIRLPTYCRAIAISPDDRRLLIGTGNDEGSRRPRDPWKPGEDCALLVCDLPSGRELKRIEHNHTVTYARWSADGSRFVTGSAAGVEYQTFFRVFDATTLAEVQDATIAEDGPENALAITSDLKRFLLQGIGGITLRDFGSGRVVFGFPNGQPTHDLAFSHDSKFALVACGGSGDPYGRYRVPWIRTHDNVVRIFDLSVPTPPTVSYFAQSVTVAPGKTQTPNPLCICESPDGRRLMVGYSQGMMHLFDTHSGAALMAFTPARKVAYPVRDVAFSPDGQLAASVQGLPSLRLWDVHTGMVSREMRANEQRVLWSVAYSSDGRFVFAGTSNGPGGTGAVMFDSATGAQIRLFLGHKETVVRVLVSRDGRQMATITRGGWGSFRGADRKPTMAEIAVWEVDSGRLLRRFDPQSDHFADATFLEGHLLAIACDDLVHLWDVDAGTDRQIEEHGGNVLSLAASRDGSMLLSVGSDQLAFLTNVRAGQVEQRLNSEGQFKPITHAIFAEAAFPAVVSGVASEPLVLEPLGP